MDRQTDRKAGLTNCQVDRGKHTDKLKDRWATSLTNERISRETDRRW